MHVALDSFTHEWGWFARNVTWYDDVLISGFLGRNWSPFRIAQYVGHVAGTTVCVAMLANLGKQRWMAGRAAAVPPVTKNRRSALALSISTAGGAAAGLGWIIPHSLGAATDIMRLAATTFVGLTLGAILAARATSLRT